MDILAEQSIGEYRGLPYLDDKTNVAGQTEVKSVGLPYISNVVRVLSTTLPFVQENWKWTWHELLHFQFYNSTAPTKLCELPDKHLYFDVRSCVEGVGVFDAKKEEPKTLNQVVCG